MRVYISGAITGTTDYAERFKAAEDRLTKAGYEVINPAKVCSSLPASTTHKQYMTICLKLVDMADALYVLRNWENSVGVSVEIAEAIKNSISIYFEQEE